MTINSVDILFNWYDQNESALTWLKEKADEGDKECLADLIGIYTELTTNAEEVQENLAQLKKLSDEGVSRASLVLGILYNEGLCKNSKAKKIEYFVEENFELSDFYLERAAEKNDPVALFMLGMHAWFSRLLSKHAGEPDTPFMTSTKQDFINGIKWLEKLIAIAEDDSADEVARDYAKEHMVVAKGFIEDLKEKIKE